VHGRIDDLSHPQLLQGHAARVLADRGNRALPLLRARQTSATEPLMKRCHVHVSVDDLDTNVRFYSTVFGAPPTVRQDDYAKWMMEDHRRRALVITAPPTQHSESSTGGV
jgi:hypothetical protein